MIGLLRGTVAAVGEDAALIDVSGVGYVIQAGSRTLNRLSVGDSATVHIETVVREDSIRLFAFLSEEERGWFTHLQSVPSVGAKVALNILDVMAPGELIDAVALGDKAAISRANGVGPKLAARIAQELAGKPPPRGFLSMEFAPKARAPGDAPAPPARGDAVSALVNLGIDASTATRAVAAAMKGFEEEPPAPELIRAALREVNR